MFSLFFNFELRYWMRRFMLFIFLFIITAMVVAAMSSDNVQIGGSVGNTNRNAPFVIQSFYSIMALITCLMTTAFVNDAASRDFAHQSYQLIFSKPINKYPFLMGRFWGAFVVAMVPILGVSLGAVLTPSMPWIEDASKYGPIDWAAHFWGIVAFAVPNTILIGALIFAIAIWLRSTFASFIGIILILMFYGMTQSLIGNLENETFAQLADPFGVVAFQTQTRYWTTADKNILSLTLGNPMLLYNRLIWLGVGFAILGTACWRFSFAERNQKSVRKTTVEALPAGQAKELPRYDVTHDATGGFRQLVSQFKIDFLSTVKSPVFLVIIFASLVDTFFSLRTVANEGFGLSALPVTYSMIQIIRGG
ncbi:MAG: ABC transporter permease, partial [Planctomycetota bacterium]